jgi:SAM-dependent methyltransferase
MRPLWWRWVKIIRKYKSSGFLLDVGCGEGYFLQYAERYFKTYGIDISEYGIREARQRAIKSKLYVGGVAPLYYDDKSFDIVTCFDVLEHLKNPEAALQECKRVLNRGGLFIIRVPNTSSLGSSWKKEEWFGYKDKTHVWLLPNNEWLSLLRKNNFQILEVFYDGLWDTPYIKIIPKFLQDIFIKFPSQVLFFLGLRFTERYGENLCVVAQKGN